ncbi:MULTISPECIES: hypothetical protein [unclassified Cellulophaga]|uniref:hypothetical protein n=1 Tax=unclassified Cellulophaga TaxID=2634405 RepID=UPI0026E34E11|nr:MULTISPECIES: hypothetical protein [unclassified Cellulophaga]MDO6491805.1 hypothetical protein [Cellulophaga sp. 2_MG-2023]MDO6495540.1 hypothetical protein [Cellulophaga sp. 3_MG-2023]
MKFNTIDKKKNVRGYALKENEVWWNSDFEVFNNKGISVIKSNIHLQKINSDNNSLFISDIEGSSFLIDKNVLFLKDVFILKKICKNELLVEHLNRVGTELLDIKNNKFKKILNERLFGFLIKKNTLFYKKDKIQINSISILKAKLKWQYNLEDLAQYQDRNGKMQNYEVHKFIGAWQNSILVACSGQLVLDINSNTGELNRKWQALPGYGSSAFQGRLQHKIPSTDGFQLDISKSYLYHLAGAYLVTIDLVTGKADYQSLKNTLEEHVFSGFRWSTGYAEDETHIYTIAEMNRLKLGLDYIPQCIVAFNKKTLKIDWHYRFEGDWIKTDIPQLANNKLYQLSGDNTLYIFEKEE